MKISFVKEKGGGVAFKSGCYSRVGAEIEILTFRFPYISQQMAERALLADHSGIGTYIRVREFRNCVVKDLGFDTRARGTTWQAAVLCTACRVSASGGTVHAGEAARRNLWGLENKAHLPRADSGVGKGCFKWAAPRSDGQILGLISQISRGSTKCYVLSSPWTRLE